MSTSPQKQASKPHSTKVPKKNCLVHGVIFAESEVEGQCDGLKGVQVASELRQGASQLRQGQEARGRGRGVRARIKASPPHFAAHASQARPVLRGGWQEGKSRRRGVCRRRRPLAPLCARHTVHEDWPAPGRSLLLA